ALGALLGGGGAPALLALGTAVRTAHDSVGPRDARRGARLGAPVSGARRARAAAFARGAGRGGLARFGYCAVGAGCGGGGVCAARRARAAAPSAARRPALGGSAFAAPARVGGGRGADRTGAGRRHVSPGRGARGPGDRRELRAARAQVTPSRSRRTHAARG